MFKSNEKELLERLGTEFCHACDRSLGNNLEDDLKELCNPCYRLWTSSDIGTDYRVWLREEREHNRKNLLDTSIT